MCKEENGEQTMNDVEIMTLVNTLASSLHEKLNTVITNQAAQQTQIELIKRDIIGNGTPGIKQKLTDHEERLDCLEVRPQTKLAQRIPWIIGGTGIISSLTIGIINLLKG